GGQGGGGPRGRGNRHFDARDRGHGRSRPRAGGVDGWKAAQAAARSGGGFIGDAGANGASGTGTGTDAILRRAAASGATRYGSAARAPAHARTPAGPRPAAVDAGPAPQTGRSRRRSTAAPP